MMTLKQPKLVTRWAIFLLGMFCYFGAAPVASAQPSEGPGGIEEPKDTPFSEDMPNRRQMRKKFQERMQKGMHDDAGGAFDGREGRMRRMGNFISFMSTFLGTVKDTHQAAGLAALSIKDSYKKQGKPLEAVKVIEDAIGSTRDQAMRNVLLFTLRQIYEENNQQAKVLEVSERILKENVAAK